MRMTCMDCVRKHIGTAMALQKEAAQGYGYYRWIAVGELCEAEAESIDKYPEFAAKVREIRCKIMKGSEEAEAVDIEPLLREACRIAEMEGEVSKDLKLGKENSKDVTYYERKPKNGGNGVPVGVAGGEVMAQ